MKKTLTFFLSSILLLSISFSQVVINEIMFNPYYETTPGDVSTYSTDDDGEFVELFNAGQSDVDMSGYQFVQGFDYFSKWNHNRSWKISCGCKEQRKI